ncbi:hypothetical protein [Oryza sativa Japonica Group]|uniref:Uncharacterized protein n=1 Tax=Oryza sativa subsp. japonica TaxID=39947 RepID=Q656U8_ORYSJ|nr:hypothetical protein [Oryza sativa Japonica Group]BAD45169.1 hypothetical protein [Oryza sativa Japonica Group]
MAYLRAGEATLLLERRWPAVVVSGGVTHATTGISSFRSRSVSGGATSSRARLTSAQSSSARNAGGTRHNLGKS